jgi:hypothetical protein
MSPIEVIRMVIGRGSRRGWIAKRSRKAASLHGSVGGELERNLSSSADGNEGQRIRMRDELAPASVTLASVVEVAFA